MLETIQIQCKSKILLYSFPTFTTVAIQNCTLYTLGTEIALREESKDEIDRKFYREGKTWLDFQE